MPARKRSPVKTRVLLLPSDSTLERGMVAALGSESCEVLAAVDGRQALAITSAGDIDLLVLDLGMRSREFPQLAAMFSLAERCSRTLVLADSLEQLTLTSEARVDGILIKPLDFNQLRTVIQNLLDSVSTRVRTESWGAATAAFSKAGPSRCDWGINE